MLLGAHSVAAKPPALSAVASAPHAATRDAERHMTRIARVDTQRMNARMAGTGGALLRRRLPLAVIRPVLLVAGDAGIVQALIERDNCREIPGKRGLVR